MYIDRYWWVLSLVRYLKGKKITKISPNKTYSGMLGSYILSIITAFYFMSYLNNNYIFLISIILSTISQIGDLFISLLKRKANLKDTEIFYQVMEVYLIVLMD